MPYKYHMHNRSEVAHSGSKKIVIQYWRIKRSWRTPWRGLLYRGRFELREGVDENNLPRIQNTKQNKTKLDVASEWRTHAEV